MLRSELTRCFSECYMEFREYGSKAIWAGRARIGIEELLSECYLHLDSNRACLDTPEDMIAMGKNWMKMNLYWPNSPIKRASRVVSEEITWENDIADSVCVDPEETLREFYGTLDITSRAIWNLCYNRKIEKGREIAEQLGVSNSSGYNILRKYRALEELLKNYITTK